MRLIQLTPPAISPVTEEMVWEHLRLNLVNGVPEDRAYVLELIKAVTGQIDGMDGLLSRALITQTWRLELDGFPPVIELPLPPCQAVLSIAYVGDESASPEYAVVDPASYWTTGLGGACKAEITPAKGLGFTWPRVARARGGVVVDFRAGYGDAPEDVPAAIRGALLETVATRYAYRESVSAGTSFSVLPLSASEALDNYRVRGF